MGRIVKDRTLLRKIPALVKLACMLVLTVVVFLDSPTTVFIACAFIAVSALLASLSVQTWLAILKTILMYGIFIALFRVIGKPLELEVIKNELIATAEYLFRLSCILVAGIVFYTTTGMTDISIALSSIQRKLGWNDRLPDIALLLSLTVGFVPRILQTWKSLERSWNARGGSLLRGFPGAWKRMTTLIPLLVICLLAVAADTDKAIRSRSVK
jgi:biotin transport system permease protein